MFENLDQIGTPFERREYISIELDSAKGYKITDILMLDSQEQAWVLEVINGTTNDGHATPQVDTAAIRPDLFTLRTVNGEPFDNVKVGVKPGLTTRQSKTLRMKGGSEYIYRDFPAQFQCPAGLAVQFLRQWGYGMVFPRYFRRHALSPAYQQKCADGTDVVARDRWLLVEVGHMFEEQARKAGDLKSIKKAKD